MSLLGTSSLLHRTQFLCISHDFERLDLVTVKGFEGVAGGRQHKLAHEARRFDIGLHVEATATDNPVPYECEEVACQLRLVKLEVELERIYKRKNR